MAGVRGIEPVGTQARWRLAGVAALVLFATALPAVLMSPREVAGGFYDDAYYYLTIARNIVEGRGVSFDGLHRTNGFHPLWLLMLLPVTALAPGDFGPIYGTVGLEILCLVLASVLLFHELAERLGSMPALAGALMPTVLPGAGAALRSGMEAALLLLLLVVAWRCHNTVQDAPHPRSRDDWKLGIVLALVALTRLEAAVVAAVVVAFGWRGFALQRRRLIPVLGPVICALAVVVVISKLYFGLWFPVSGLVKAWLIRQQPLHIRLEILMQLPWIGERLIGSLFGGEVVSRSKPALTAHVVLLVAVGIACFRFRRAISASIRQARLAFPLVSCAAIALVDKIVVQKLEYWYRTPYLLMTTLLTAALVARSSALSRVVAAIATIGVFVRAGFTLLHEGRPPWPNLAMDAGYWLRQNTQPSEPIGSWNAGFVGYFSQRHVVNLDGWVNDAEYAKELMEKRPLGPYLERESIYWLADMACAGREHEHLGDRLDVRDSRALADEFRVVFRSMHPSGCPGVVVWQRRR